MHPHPFDIAPISREIWDSKYRLKSPDGTALEQGVDDTWRRVADSVAAIEKGASRSRRWADRFFEALSAFEFMPAGRIIAGAGTGRRVTLFNCFVMGRIEDDLGSIFDNVREAALTMQQGGGIGHDFSTLRPQGAPVRSTGSDASGPVVFMDVWDAMCRSIMSAGARRGAMMGTMRCDHPDIEAFIAAKGEAARLRNFNLSVLVTDAFLDAVRNDAPWQLVFGGTVWRTLPARELWDRLMRSTYDYAEPGVIFIDRINQRNNLGYCEEIHATNPCGEQPLPPHGACLLGSINLARLVVEPFSSRARLDLERLERLASLAVRFLDNCIDVSRYPLDAQEREAKAKRRIGLGVTGLADALIMLGLHYGSREAVALAGSWMAALERAAYLASARMARKKGSFPLFDRDALLSRPHVAGLPADVRAAIARHGLRNGCIVSVAPTGTISLFAGNVSSGVEPVFDLAYTRRVRGRDGTIEERRVEDYAYALYRRNAGSSSAAGAERLPPAFVTAARLPPRAHLEMQAALQKHVDSSISKTVNCPADIPFEAFKSIYLEAYDLGLKGCTTFRPNAVTGSVLAAEPAASELVPGTPQSAAPPSAAPVASTPPQHAAPQTPLPAPDVPLVSPPAVAAGTDPAPASGIVYMSRPLERDAALAGFTYKLTWPGSDHALYVTINDIERDGRRRPFEIFINTRNLEHYAWTVALTRMISAVFRRGGDVSFVVDELKAIFDPQGGHWVAGRYVPSLLAAIGEIIESHFARIGLARAEPKRQAVAAADAPEKLTPRSSASQDGQVLDAPLGDAHTPPRETQRRPSACPRCERPDLVREEGCWTCRSCGYSRCS